MMRTAAGRHAPRPVFTPDAGVVSQLVAMGFPSARAEDALRRIGVNSVEAATEWLLVHGEEAAPLAAPAAEQGECLTERHARMIAKVTRA